MKKKSILLLITMILTTSCSKDLSQKDWHITTFELADEYFPKYIEFVETSLSNNNIQYEKEYEEENCNNDRIKYYRLKYSISIMSYYSFIFSYRGTHGIIDCSFYYKTTSENEVLNIPQNYINVMTDVVDFCSNNFCGTGEQYNTYLSTIKSRYELGDFDAPLTRYQCVQEGETYTNLPCRRGINLFFNEKEYNLGVYLIDYLTDVNIWDK